MISTNIVIVCSYDTKSYNLRYVLKEGSGQYITTQGLYWNLSEIDEIIASKGLLYNLALSIYMKCKTQ